MRLKSKYLEQFKRANELNLLNLRGDRVVVEIMPESEIKSEGGIIIAASERQLTSAKEAQCRFGIVLAVGEGYIDESGNKATCRVKPGNVVLLPELGIQSKSTWPGIKGIITDYLGLVSDSALGVYWDSIESFEKYAEEIANEQA